MKKTNKTTKANKISKTSKNSKLRNRNLRTAAVLLALTSAVALSIFYVRTRQPLNESNVIRPVAESTAASTIEPAGAPQTLPTPAAQPPLLSPQPATPPTE